MILFGWFGLHSLYYTVFMADQSFSSSKMAA